MVLRCKGAPVWSEEAPWRTNGPRPPLCAAVYVDRLVPWPGNSSIVRCLAGGDGDSVAAWTGCAE